jgi:hypothetical protein
MRQLAFRILCLWSFAVAFVSPIRGDEKKEPPRPEELKALALYLGEWKTEGVNKVAEWNPKEIKFTGTDSNQWTLKQRFMAIKGVNDTLQTESLALTGYDERKGMYMSRFFDSQGTIGEWQGKFEPKTKTFTWSFEEGGLIGMGQNRFTENTNEGFFLIKDKAGKVYFDMTFKNTRKK